MGYRSTFVTQDYYTELPQWFADKYKDDIHFANDDKGKYWFPLSSRGERKFYQGAQDELFVDLAKYLRENTEPYPKELVVALMHEDGEIDRVIITKEKVVLQRSLKYDPENDYNPQLGGSEEYEIPTEDNHA